MWDAGIATPGGERLWWDNQNDLAQKVGISRRWLVSCIHKIVTKRIGERVGRGVYSMDTKKIIEIKKRIEENKQEPG